MATLKKNCFERELRVTTLFKELLKVLKHFLADALEVTLKGTSIFGRLETLEREDLRLLDHTNQDLLDHLDYSLVVHLPQLLEGTIVDLEASIKIGNRVLSVVLIVRVAVKEACDFHDLDIICVAHDQHEQAVEDYASDGSLLTREVSHLHIDISLFVCNVHLKVRPVI